MSSSAPGASPTNIRSASGCPRRTRSAAARACAACSGCSRRCRPGSPASASAAPRTAAPGRDGRIVQGGPRTSGGPTFRMRSAARAPPGSRLMPRRPAPRRSADVRRAPVAATGVIARPHGAASSCSTRSRMRPARSASGPSGCGSSPSAAMSVTSLVSTSKPASARVTVVGDDQVDALSRELARGRARPDRRSRRRSRRAPAARRRRARARARRGCRASASASASAGRPFSIFWRPAAAGV